MSTSKRAQGCCCPKMAQQLGWECPHHKGRLECPDVLIVRAASSDSGFGLSIKDGGGASLEINFCPFCGQDLGKLAKP